MQNKKTKLIVTIVFFTILISLGFILASRLDKAHPVRIKEYRTDFDPNIVDSIELRVQESMRNKP
jgi:hypothetical protein